MSRPRPHRFPVTFALLAVGVILFDAHGFGQTPTRRDVRRSMVPAIDRGVVVDDRDAAGRAARHAIRTFAGATPAAGRLGAGMSEYVPGRVLVKFRRALSVSARTRAVRQVSRSASLGRRASNATFDHVRIDPGEDAEAVARELGRRSDVEYAQALYRAYPRFVPNDPSYASLQWNFPQVDLERGWDLQWGATSSIIIAVLDTGMAYRDAIVRLDGSAFSLDDVIYPALGPVDIPFARAPDLAAAGRTGDRRFVAPRDFIWGDNQPLDLDGHGTHVAGTIGQLTNNGVGVAGIAFNARLMPVKVISTTWDDIFNSPNVGTDETVAQGIRYAAATGATVINMSIGRSGAAGSAPAVEEAIRYAVDKGCFVAIAGGNGFGTGNAVEVYAEIASRVKGAVSVAATDRTRRRASYSTTGPWIELAAPGGSFASGGVSGLVFQQTYDFFLADTYRRSPGGFAPPRFDTLALAGLQGTSMATPHVSGMAALLRQQGITKPAAIEAALERFATDLGPAGRDDEFGFGEVSARATLRGLGLAR